MNQTIENKNQTMRNKAAAPYYIFCLLSTTVLSLAVPAAISAGKPTYFHKMQMAQLLQFNGNIEQAIKAYKFASALKPDAAEPHLSLAVIYAQQRNTDAAREEAKQCQDLKPSLAPMVHQALLNTFAQQQNIPAALEECKECVKLKPNNKQLHYFEANLLMNVAGSKSDEEDRKKLLKQAAEEFEAAIKLGFDDEHIKPHLPVLYLQTGDYDKGLEIVNGMLEDKDKQPEVHLVKGVLLFKKADADSALKEMDIAIAQKDGKYADAHNTKAQIYMSQGKMDEAKAEYKKALDDDPKFIPALVAMSNSLIQQQKWEDALALLEKANEVKPGDANTLYSIAICYERMGKAELAIPKFNEGLAVDPNDQTKGQIRQHLMELQRNSFLSVPGLNMPGVVGPNAGSSLFGQSSLLSQPIDQLIKVTPLDDKEEKKELKKAAKLEKKSEKIDRKAEKKEEVIETKEVRGRLKQVKAAEKDAKAAEKDAKAAGTEAKPADTNQKPTDNQDPKAGKGKLKAGGSNAGSEKAIDPKASAQNANDSARKLADNTVTLADSDTQTAPSNPQNTDSEDTALKKAKKDFKKQKKSEKKEKKAEKKVEKASKQELKYEEKDEEKAPK